MFCRTCAGPAEPGFARCYQCDRALREAGGLLADAVAPAGYAVRGGTLAADLYRYKSAGTGELVARQAAGRLTGLLREFLAGHGPALWQAAGMTAGPALAAVVPSGQGRPGPHPLAAIVRSCLDLPLARLAVRPAEVHGRGVNPGWVRVADRVAGTDVLVVDDTWVSGGSAQSVAAALKQAGARRVAVVVLGRHVNPADRRSEKFVAALSPPPRAVRQEGETMTEPRKGDCHAVRLADLHQAGDRGGAQPGRAGDAHG
jgi:hypothetical protein